MVRPNMSTVPRLSARIPVPAAPASSWCLQWPDSRRAARYYMEIRSSILLKARRGRKDDLIDGPRRPTAEKKCAAQSCPGRFLAPLTKPPCGGSAWANPRGSRCVSCAVSAMPAQLLKRSITDNRKNSRLLYDAGGETFAAVFLMRYLTEPRPGNMEQTADTTPGKHCGGSM